MRGTKGGLVTGLRAAAIALVAAGSASAAHSQSLVTIGDTDGFGYVAAPLFVAANGGPANADGLGVLNAGDFLPDLNGDGFVATGSADDFDLRSAAEAADTAFAAGTGVTILGGTTGALFTDISLSTSYDTSSGAGAVLVGGTGASPVYGAGGAFPSPPSSTVPNQPGFKFRFTVSKADIVSTDSVFFNLVFGDYDVTPANITLTRTDGSTRTLALATQPGAADGLVQAATATLSFGEIFTDGGAVWDGALDVDFIAPAEPYTSFDYVELSRVPLVSPVPEPGALVSLGGMVAGGVLALRRRRR